ncbi:hypothetical protein BG006_008535 [Podila minutissima]|uniref:Sodium/calcium exchanger membrane region domain-containing protein n=1 Tax=Podila minutissima TaxID=64525 RepID=A0A9P5SIL3_9FUNG|nr:hypothetical protein BG006_008535 [Podila minutissima]
MSQPSTRTLRFQDEEAGIQQQSTPRSNATYLTVSTPNSPAPQAQPLLSPSTSRSSSRSARSQHLSAHPSNGSSANNGRLRPRPSILRQRLRSLQYNNDEDPTRMNQQIAPSIPPVPRRRVSNYNPSMSLLRGNSTSPTNNNSDADLDTAGLLQYASENGASTSWPVPGRRPLLHSGDTIELQSVPLSATDPHDYYGDKAEYEEVKLEDKSSSPPHHHRRLDELIHGNRPDRHLFPYRTAPENLHAAKTFFRRFFLVLLIIPGWIIPNVLGKANEEAEIEGAEHPEKLSKELNILVFLLNMFAMMHLGKAAGACLEELVPKLGATGMNLLMIVIISYVIPVGLDTTLTDLRTKALPESHNQTEFFEQIRGIHEQVNHDILTISKIMAVIMLVLYGCCLLYQWDSRSFMVTPEAKHTEQFTVHRRNVHYWFAGWAYAAMLTAQIYSANILVHSVEELGKQFHLNDSFVGFVLLPIVLIADLQEEVIAIKESRANHLDRSIALMIGSCMQIALLVTPLLVLLGWIIDQPLTFRFTLMEVVILAGSVMIVNYLIQDNTTNWLEGCMLLAAFFMCALAFYFDVTKFTHSAPGAGGHGESGRGEGGGH